MKRLITVIVLSLTLSLSVWAGDFAMRKAIGDLVGNKQVKVDKSTSKGKDPSTASTPSMQWMVTVYGFCGETQRVKPLLEKVVKAYDKDIDNPDVLAAFQSTDNLEYTIDYSRSLPALAVGSVGMPSNKIIIVGNEQENVNTVIAVAWVADPLTDQIMGSVYVVQRDPWFANLSERQIREEAVTESSENLRRLAFYADKYDEQLMEGGTGSAIVKATIFVVDEIIRNGSPQEKKQAQTIIDTMVAMTPNIYISAADRREINSGNETLLNLLKRLDSNYNPAKYISSPKTFTLDGSIDDGLWDIGYYIYMGDDDMVIDTNNAELIKADGQHFFYQTELDEVKLGRVRALFKDGTICSAWIEMLFVPGETAELSVHNGHYSLTGSGFYKQWSDVINEMYMLNSEDDFMNYVISHIEQPGALCFIFKEGGLPVDKLREIYQKVPDDIKSSAYGVYLRRFL